MKTLPAPRSDAAGKASKRGLDGFSALTGKQEGASRKPACALAFNGKCEWLFSAAQKARKGLARFLPQHVRQAPCLRENLTPPYERMQRRAPSILLQASFSQTAYTLKFTAVSPSRSLPNS